MFGEILTRWREARGTVLLKEVIDCLDKLSASHGTVQAIAGMMALRSLARASEQFGPINNLSNDRRRHIAKLYRDIARKSYDGDVGAATGIFLVSAFIEASSLPGIDAKSAFEMTLDYFERMKMIIELSTES